MLITKEKDFNYKLKGPHSTTDKFFHVFILSDILNTFCSKTLPTIRYTYKYNI